MSTELRVDENEMAVAVELALLSLPEPRATFAELREIVPNYLTLHRGDRARIPSRQSEEKWFQTIRNIKIHPELHPQFEAIDLGMRLLSSSGLEKRIARSVIELPKAEARLTSAEKRKLTGDALEPYQAAVTLHRGIVKNGPPLLPRLRGYEKKSSRRIEKAKLQKVG